MRIALIAPPFITVPPQRYGGTELFIAQLAEGLAARGVDVVVYTNGQSRVAVETRWLYAEPQWPIKGEIFDNLKDMNHSSWAMADAARDSDLIHVNNVPALMQTRQLAQPAVYTVHHPNEPFLTEIYQYFPDMQFVTISDFQRNREPMPRIRTIRHGVDTSLYKFREKKQRYLSFIGRIAPMKGTHLAIQIAHRTGIPLKIAGEIQPIFRSYFEEQIKPHLGDSLVEYIGEADLAAKNELLSNSLAMVFPIQWDEPFGLVMIEAMACGTPVVAMRRGSVPEVVRDGVSGYVCCSVDQMVERIRTLDISPQGVRDYVERDFSIARMVEQYIALYGELLEPSAGASAPAGHKPARRAAPASSSQSAQDVAIA